MAAIITHRDMDVNTLRVRRPSRSVNNGAVENFAQRLKRLRKAAGLTQEQLAHACGYNGQSRIANYEATGPNARLPSLEEIPVLARALRVDEAQLVMTLPPRAGEDQDWPDVLGFRQAASLGPGAAPDDYAETHKLKFRADSLRKKHLRPDRLGVVYGKGDSMLPRIRSGDAILFDMADTEPKDGALYVISYKGDLLAKRLSLLGGRWFIESLNQNARDYRKPQPIDEFEQFKIHGRVRWIGSWED